MAVRRRNKKLGAGRGQPSRYGRGWARDRGSSGSGWMQRGWMAGRVVDGCRREAVWAAGKVERGWDRRQAGRPLEGSGLGANQGGRSRG